MRAPPGPYLLSVRLVLTVRTLLEGCEGTETGQVCRLGLKIGSKVVIELACVSKGTFSPYEAVAEACRPLLPCLLAVQALLLSQRYKCLRGFSMQTSGLDVVDTSIRCSPSYKPFLTCAQARLY